jgi:hypothetical protein
VVVVRSWIDAVEKKRRKLLSDWESRGLTSELSASNLTTNLVWYVRSIVLVWMRRFGGVDQSAPWANNKQDYEDRGTHIASPDGRVKGCWLERLLARQRVAA